MLRGDDWRDRALCAHLNPDIWFPVLGGSALEAKRICAVCPVSGACLAHAMSTAEPDGIYGGLNARARGRLRLGLELEEA